MKHFLIATFVISIILLNVTSILIENEKHKHKHKKHQLRKVHKHKLNARNGTAGNSTNSTNSTNTIKTIPFDKKPAAEIAEKLNSAGDKVVNSVILKSFPFKINRCDSILMFPCVYINDKNNYGIRKEAFCAITAYYTNLYASKDGQKLIQQVLHSLMMLLPQEIQGAEGCVRIGGVIGLKDMDICTKSKVEAQNLIEVYRSFSRCRLGDNLAPVPTKDLAQIIKLCDINKNALLQKPNEPVRNVPAEGKFSSQAMQNKPSQEEIDRQTRMKLLNKNLPQFDIPKKKHNKWERNRLKYFMPSKLRVPGQSPPVKLPPGIQPGSNPLNNPGIEPPMPTVV